MNEPFWIVLEIITNIYQSFLVMHFICSSFNNDFRFSNGKMIFVFGSLINALLLTVLNGITSYEGLLGIIYSIYFFGFSLLFLKGSVLKKLFISIFTNLCIAGISSAVPSFVSVVLKGSMDSIYNTNSVARLLTIAIVQVVLTYLFLVLLHFTKDKVNSLKAKEWGLIISIFGISFITFLVIHIAALTSDLTSSILLLTAELGIILINVVCWYITISLSKSNKAKEELIALNKQNEYSQKYAQTVKEQYEQTRRLRHDMKQYNAVLDRLISDKKYDEARELISENYKTISRSEVVIDVGNDLINAILNSKLTLTKSLGIDVICSTEKDLSGIESADLCSLIGNLLDNAIEAAQLCEPEKRSIELNISTSGSRMNITVRNSISRSVLKENPKLTTTKSDRSEHGFGIKTIKFISEKYNGSTDFYEEGGFFISRIEIYRQLITE